MTRTEEAARALFMAVPEELYGGIFDNAIECFLSVVVDGQRDIGVFHFVDGEVSYDG